MSKKISTGIFISLSLLLTGCGPMMCKSEGKCGGKMDMTKNKDMKYSSGKDVEETKK